MNPRAEDDRARADHAREGTRKARRLKQEMAFATAARAWLNRPAGSRARVLAPSAPPAAPIGAMAPPRKRRSRLHTVAR